MDTAYFYLTDEGRALALKLSASRPGDLYGKEHFKEQLTAAFSRYDYLVCIMAAGIVVRILSPLIVHKTSDPGVVVMDQRGRYAISLLSGHLGGANDLAREMAALSGGDPVITTATDVAGELSFDSFAKAHGMAIENIGQLKHISGALLSGRPIRVVTNYSFPELTAAAKEGKMLLVAPEGLMGRREKDMDDEEKREPEGQMPLVAPEGLMGRREDEDREVEELHSLPTVVIDEGLTLPNTGGPVLYLRPRTICAGIGCKRNMDRAPIEEALLSVLSREGLSPLSLKCISTIPLKAEEPGILSTANHLKVPVTIIDPEEIKALDIEALGIRPSDFVAEQTGVLSVSTASSYLASGKGTILVDKVKFKGITIALSKCREV